LFGVSKYFRLFFCLLYGYYFHSTFTLLIQIFTDNCTYLVLIYSLMWFDTLKSTHELFSNAVDGSRLYLVRLSNCPNYFFLFIYTFSMCVVVHVFVIFQSNTNTRTSKSQAPSWSYVTGVHQSLVSFIYCRLHVFQF
jgi:hypothetical protein